MTVELKHLAPYLPYQLNISCEHEILTLDGLDVNGDVYNCDTGEIPIECIKPILRPLSDLKENLELKENLYKSHKINMYWHKWEALENKNNYKELEYLPKCIFDMLVENHFDVFGLIEKGLAIDKNKIA
jgi:hypothetical protein